MKAERAVSAKITRPGITGAVKRKRLFGLLDARMKKPVLWVSSPAGSGKTTLVLSYVDSRRLPCIWYHCDEGDSDPATFFYYMGLAARKAAPRRRKPLPLLKPEYVAGLGTFARRYFEELYDRIAGSHSPGGTAGGRFTVILDDYHNVPAGSPFHDIIANGLDIVPEGVNVVIMSRSDPPPQMARLHASSRMGFLEFEDLRFTFKESKELVSGRIPRLDERSIRQMHENIRGWVAGIILMLETARLNGAVTGSALDARGYEKVFDYFAGEIFDKAEKEVQDFLLKTSFLPALSVPAAEKLTGAAHAERILSMLNRRNYFTERLSGGSQDYQYHPLFREFLLNRSKTVYSPDELAAIRKDAALLMEQTGRIEDAARLYLDASEVQYLSRMVIRHAQELLRQGRNRTVAEWIAGIPDVMSAGNPWLLYWNAMCFFPFDMARTRDVLEKALVSFKAVDDASGQYLSWARIVDTYVFELDEWKRFDECISVFEELRKEYPAFPSTEIDLVASSRMLISLILRRTDRPGEIAEWSGHVLELLKEDPSPDIQLDIMFYTSIYHLWRGDYHKNAVLLEEADAQVLHHRQPPLAVIRIKMMRGIHDWVTARYGTALRAFSEALETAGKSGVHVFDSLLASFAAAAEMAAGNMGRAGAYLQEQKTAAFATGNSLEIFFYYINAAWESVLKENPSLAVEYLKLITARVDRIGNPYYQALWHIGMAQARFMAGNIDEAKTHIEKAHRIGLDMKSRVIEWYSLLVSAYFLFSEGSEAKALPPLRRALALGGRHGYAHLEFYQPKAVGLLCMKALEYGIEPAYVKALIKKLKLTPPAGIADAARAMESWPYAVQIYTMGRFEIFKDGVALAFSGKVQKKPLEMLKAVIAFGGTNVAADQIADALWPDADGDLARKSFEVTLSRLRHLLGGENVLRYRAGQLSIDPLTCRVDSLALEHLLTRLKDLGDDKAVALCEAAAGLYGGPFLPSDAGLTWTTRRRETLKNWFLRTILAAGQFLERSGKWEAAAEYYMKGIDTDELAEEFYQHLMVCYRQLGNNAGAVRAYHRCCAVLREKLGVRPSGQTETIYASIVERRPLKPERTPRSRTKKG